MSFHRKRVDSLCDLRAVCPMAIVQYSFTSRQAPTNLPCFKRFSNRINDPIACVRRTGNCGRIQRRERPNMANDATAAVSSMAAFLKKYLH